MTLESNRMIYIDTSVIVNSFFTKEEGSENSRELMKKIREGIFTASTSQFTLMEVASAISRRSKDSKLAREFVGELQLYPNLTIVPISKILFDKAFDIAADHGLRTGDSIQAACAILEGAESLIQRDVEFGKVREMIEVKEPKNLLRTG